MLYQTKTRSSSVRFVAIKCTMKKRFAIFYLLHRLCSSSNSQAAKTPMCWWISIRGTLKPRLLSCLLGLRGFFCLALLTSDHIPFNILVFQIEMKYQQYHKSKWQSNLFCFMKRQLCLSSCLTAHTQQ